MIRGTLKAGTVLGLVALVSACGPNKIDGSVLGEDFGDVRGAIFVGDASADTASFRLLIASYNDACANFQSYVQTQEYPIDNALADEADASPKYLLFTVGLLDVEVLGEHEVLPPGEFYDGTTSSVSGRYRYADGDGNFSEILMEGGTFTLDTVEEATLLTGALDVSLDNGDALSGKFEAVYCEP